jgi:hypothetical protein
VEDAPALVRCRRAERCVDRERIPNPDVEHGDRVVDWVWAGLVIHNTGGPDLCPTCIRYVRYALNDLAGDVEEITEELLIPSSDVRYRDPDMPAQKRIKLHSPVPFDLDAKSLQELIDQELTMWATAVWRALDPTLPGPEPDSAWNPHLAASSRQLPRVRWAVRYLTNRLDTLLALPVTETRARSRTARRADGHDEDVTTRFGDDYWTRRDGVTAGLLFIDLHHLAEKLSCRAPADRLPVPCPECRRLTLLRLHGQGRVECEHCRERWTDDQYEQLHADTAARYGIAV